MGDRLEMLAHDMQAGIGQKVVHIRNAARDRVLDRNHAVARGTAAHGGDGVLEGRAGQRRELAREIDAGDVGVGARLALIGDARPAAPAILSLRMSSGNLLCPRRRNSRSPCSLCTAFSRAHRHGAPQADGLEARAGTSTPLCIDAHRPFGAISLRVPLEASHAQRISPASRTHRLPRRWQPW